MAQSCVTLCTTAALQSAKPLQQPVSIIPMRYLTVTSHTDDKGFLARAVALQHLVREHMPKADRVQFWPDDLPFWQDCLDRGGCLVLAFCAHDEGKAGEQVVEHPVLLPDDSLLAGYFLLRLPGDAADNLGRDTGLVPSEHAGVTAHLESVAVHPAFRGRGLALTMGSMLVEEARRRNVRHLFATVSPANTASLHMLERLGLKVYETKLKYAGLLRHIMYRTL